jgi:hypothetical protein
VSFPAVLGGLPSGSVLAGRVTRYGSGRSRAVMQIGNDSGGFAQLLAAIAEMAPEQFLGQLRRIRAGLGVRACRRRLVLVAGDLRWHTSVYLGAWSDRTEPAAARTVQAARPARPGALCLRPEDATERGTGQAAPGPAPPGRLRVL